MKPKTNLALLGALAMALPLLTWPSAFAAKVHYCFGHKATIVGTKGDDDILGTDGPDVIVGLAGNDVIQGLGGPDLICLGPGGVRVGFHGHPTRYGEPNEGAVGDTGRDRISGGPGDDVIQGAQGRDVIKGGHGADELIGNGAKDTIFGGPESDHLGGDGADDVLRGGPGSDDMHRDGGETASTEGPTASPWAFLTFRSAAAEATGSRSRTFVEPSASTSTRAW